MLHVFDACLLETIHCFWGIFFFTWLLFLLNIEPSAVFANNSEMKAARLTKFRFVDKDS